jgi:Ca-activated chloride channel family protein
MFSLIDQLAVTTLWPLVALLGAVLVWWFWPVLASSRVLYLPFFARWQRWAEARHVGQKQPKPWARIGFYLGFAMLVLAAMRPVWLLPPDAQWQTGRTWWLAIDLSASMERSDFVQNGQEVTRWQLLKEQMQAWLATRQGDRIGVIGFGSNAFVVHPPSGDLAFVSQQLSLLQPGMAGGQTAMGEALGLAVLAKNRWPMASGVWTLLMVSDGSNTDALDPLQMASIAHEKGLRIHTLGLGPLTEEERLAREGVWRGNRPPEPTQGLDEAMLKQIAQLGGGQYVRLSAAGAQSEMADLMNQLERVEQPDFAQRPQIDLSAYLLLLAWLAWCAAWLLKWRDGRNLAGESNR